MSRINYDGRVFRPVAEVEGGDVGADTVFHYHQKDNIVWSTYCGGQITFGTLIASVDERGHLTMTYQQICADGSHKTGKCRSKPERLADGRIRLHETWQWMSGDEGSGTSIVEEVSA